MLSTSNLDTQLKDWVKAVRGLCPHHMVEGDFPEVTWDNVIEYSLQPIAIMISAEEM